ncbi:DDE-type integrase/transposase/recombinase [Limosilactobacillus mucosae]|nr:DDE-type integrase/transposase/recombinase [Limosilactobacillus mucosae]MDC2844297.1 DDE-type integrase/transposase/recombinase [Limosilactobacillus mucosae]
MERKFIQVAPNLVWVSDTTELTYGRNNKVRLHVVLDLYGRYALSYHISPTETAEAAMEVFKRAAKQTLRAIDSYRSWRCLYFKRLQ